jgi:ubiquinone biosynthesis monooxygenase Coq7
MNVKEIIKVDHAGERGAIRIYEGQLAALQLTKKDREMEKMVIHMKEHEQEHLAYFEGQLAERNMRPTPLLPLWDFAGFALGFGSALMGKKYAMQCTASVEETIDTHYQNQIDWTRKNTDENELADKMAKFREDELEHRDTAYFNGADMKGPLKLVDFAIKTGCKVAIELTKRS